MVTVRRIVLWVLATVTPWSLLFGYHTSTSGAPRAPAIGRPRPTSAPAGRLDRRHRRRRATTRSGHRPGPAVQTRWGPVQVADHGRDGKITDVDVLQYPDGNNRDQEINDDALPILVQETISAQSADIDMVSGATVTSDGYVQSLQSALDQAGL